MQQYNVASLFERIAGPTNEMDAPAVERNSRDINQYVAKIVSNQQWPFPYGVQSFYS